MKKRIRFLVLLTTAVLLLAMFTGTVLAETVQDGLKVEISTDKEEYESNEDINLTVTVTNTNDFEVMNVRIESILPEGLTLKSGQAVNEVETLQANEVLELLCVLIKTDEVIPTPDSPTPTPEQPEVTPTPSVPMPTEEPTPPKAGGSMLFGICIGGLLIALAGLIFTLVYRHTRKVTRVISIILCLAIALPSLTGLFMLRAKALENDNIPKKAYINKSFEVSKDIIVDGELISIVIMVSYTNPNADSNLINFSADETYFITGYSSTICFTIEVTNAVDEDAVYLFNDNNLLAAMNDDGLNGDIIANDKVYTCCLEIYAEDATSLDYYAKMNDEISNIITVYFFPTPTETTRVLSERIKQELSDIEQEFVDEDGFVPISMRQTVISAVADYIKTLHTQGLVINYEISEDGILFKLSTGQTIVYSPNVNGFDSMGLVTSINISTYQPCLDTYPNSIDDYLLLPDRAATQVSTMFNNYDYSDARNFDNNEVTLARIKSFTSNEVIVWHGHGYYDPILHSILWTGEDFDYNAWWWDIGYWWDTVQDRIIKSAEGTVGITSKYIDKYCENLSNSFIYLATCSSGKDSTLADAFLKKGARAVIGTTDAILTTYNLDMQYSTIYNMTQINGLTHNYNTLNEALTLAKSQHGDTDAARGGLGATPVIFGGILAEDYRFASYISKYFVIEAGTLRVTDEMTSVQVPIYVQNFNSADFTIEYDPDKLEYTGYVEQMLIRETVSHHDGSINISFNNEVDNYSANILDLKFNVLEGFEDKAHLTITYHQGTYIDKPTSGYTPIPVNEDEVKIYNGAIIRDTEVFQTTPMVAAGGAHTVGLKSDGKVIGTGNNIFNITDWTDIVAVSAGKNHTVGLKSNGTVVAVGYSYDGQCNVSNWTDMIAVSAGRNHTVALKNDGTVEAIGRDWWGYGQLDISDWTDIVAISTKYTHTVGLKNDGTVVAVGWNVVGECNVSEWTDIVAISAGRVHTVGLKSNRTVVAVGSNYDGQCNVSNWTDIIAVSAGRDHTVALKNDGTVVAVGLNNYGQCNVTDWTDIIAISTGDDHTVGLKSDGTVIAVGRNEDLQCNVSNWIDIVDISGVDHTIGLKRDGKLLATGYNLFGQRDVLNWTDIVDVSTGWGHTIGLKNDGTVVAVGNNNDGQCNVTDWTDIVAVSAGKNHTAGLKSNGTVVAVGYNEYDGRCDVEDWTDIVAISAGNSHTIGLKSDGTVVAVGYSQYGLCDVEDWTDIVAISAGGSHTVGLKSDGTVVAVGFNRFGQCNVTGWTDIVAISTGYNHTIGLKSDGTVVAVGYNSYGQLNCHIWNLFQ